LQEGKGDQVIGLLDTDAAFIHDVRSGDFAATAIGDDETMESLAALVAARVNDQEPHSALNLAIRSAIANVNKVSPAAIGLMAASLWMFHLRPSSHLTTCWNAQGQQFLEVLAARTSELSSTWHLDLTASGLTVPLANTSRTIRQTFLKAKGSWWFGRGLTDDEQAKLASIDALAAECMFEEIDGIVRPVTPTEESFFEHGERCAGLDPEILAQLVESIPSEALKSNAEVFEAFLPAFEQIDAAFEGVGPMLRLTGSGVALAYVRLRQIEANLPPLLSML